MKKFTQLLLGFLLSLLILSCSSKKNEIDRTTPEKTIISLIDAINSNDKEIIDSIIKGNSNLDILQSIKENSNLKVVIDKFEELESDSSEVSLRVKLSVTDSTRKEKIFDKLISLRKQNKIWIIRNTQDFSFGSPTEISEDKALKLVYGLPTNGENGVSDSIFREPIKSLRIDNRYVLLSISQKGEWSGTGTEQYVNGAILNWNGIRWVLKERVDSIMSSYDSNHGGIYIDIAYHLKDNSIFFLLNDYQEGEIELINNYTFLDQNLKVFYEYNYVRQWNPPFAGGDGSIENKPMNLPESCRFYTYKYNFQNVIKNNKNLRQRVRFDENDQPIYMEYWYKDRDEIMSEGGVVQDPSNSQNALYDGYWYDKSTGFKGEYIKGRLVNNNVDMSNFFKVQANVEKCQWCKLGVIVNGYCDMCGIPSQSTRNELNDNINSRNINSNSLSCPNKAMHRTLRYPEECPYCGYVGLIK